MSLAAGAIFKLIKKILQSIYFESGHSASAQWTWLDVAFLALNFF
jgi:hypothetical protein